ncbi:MAG: PAS domain S-box protein [SAR324 cluster bacterium]|nr:PAS domain S-box protein [SAR324 cluster bacterium]
MKDQANKYRSKIGMPMRRLHPKSHEASFVANVEGVAASSEGEIDWKELIYHFPANNPNPIMLVDKTGVVRFSNNAAIKICVNWYKKGEHLPHFPFTESLERGFRLKTLVSLEETIEDDCYNFKLQRTPCGSGVYVYGEDVSDKKALIREQATAQRYLDITRVIIVVIGQDGIVQMVNQIGCEILGYSEDEIVGHNWFDNFLPVEMRKEVKAYNKKVLNQEAEHISEFENAILTKSGEVRIIEWGNVILTDDQGFATGSLSSGIDITERKEAQAELLEKEQQYRQMFESNLAIKLVIDPAGGQIVDANQAALQFYGYSKSELCSINITDINQLTVKQVQKEMDLALKEKRLYFNFLHKVASGEVRAVEVYSGPFKSGNKLLLYSIIHDVSAKRAAEQKYQETFNLSAIGITHVDPSGIIIQSNPHFCQTLGVKESEMIGQAFTSLMHVEDVEKQASCFEDLLSKKRKKIHKERRFLRPDGSIVWANVSMSLSCEFNGEPNHLILVIEDISGQKKNLEALAKSENSLIEAIAMAKSAAKAKTRFLAIMSHELRTPLNGVIGVAQLLADELQDDPDKRELVDLILRSGNSLLEIFHDILNLSRINAERFHSSKVTFAPQHLAEKLKDLFESAAMQKGIDLVIEIDPKLSQYLIGDIVTLEQVLSNIMGNGVKFTKFGSVKLEISKVSGSAKAEVVKFAVMDTGIGIEPKNQEKIFEVFTQADESTTRNFEGTGLGLTISKRLIKILGGEITLTSDVGRGSCFEFQLKLPTESNI